MDHARFSQQQHDHDHDPAATATSSHTPLPNAIRQPTDTTVRSSRSHQDIHTAASATPPAVSRPRASSPVSPGVAFVYGDDGGCDERFSPVRGLSLVDDETRESAAAAVGGRMSMAEEIVKGTQGPVRHGAIVGKDGNMHAYPPRPVTMLPPCCEGARGLAIPDLLKGNVANVTLPSRLALLGRQSYEIIATLNPVNIGNSVLGFAPVWGGKHSPLRNDLFVLPSIFSIGGARITVFLRILLLLVFLVFFLQFSQVSSINIGRAWFFGSSIAIFTMYRLALQRRAPDGVIAFCQSMGASDTEPYMFSYSWKVEPDAIRTLAKAMWNCNCPVWIDVVKLCPGDEIRPMVRTMVNRVYRVVIFLSPAYIQSPNCCVEFHEAAQWPEKLLLCILQPVPQLEPFLHELESRGAVVVYGLRACIEQLDAEVCDVNDAAAWKWWRRQQISGGGVPSHVVPTHWHTIPKFSLNMRTIRVPQRSLTAGPVYLAGDCSSTGLSFYPPYLFFLALLALASNFIDLWITFEINDCSGPDGSCSSNCRDIIDYVWLLVIACCNLAPFTVWRLLFETRTDVHPVLRPLLASKSMNGGVKIKVEGDATDPIVNNLNAFLTKIGHNAQDKPRPLIMQKTQLKNRRKKTIMMEQAQKEGTLLANSSKKNSAVAPAPPPPTSTSTPTAADDDCEGLLTLAPGLEWSRCITIYVMRSFAQRDALFGTDNFPFDPRTSLFVWSDPHTDPFTKDETGARMMRFLVLVSSWEKKLLAENLFSAVGVRVVDMLHAGDAELELESEQEQMIGDTTLEPELSQRVRSARAHSTSKRAQAVFQQQMAMHEQMSSASSPAQQEMKVQIKSHP